MPEHKIRRGILLSLLVVGIVALLIGSFIEYSATNEFGKSWLFQNKTWVSLLKEIGFAALIAFAVTITIEQYTRRIDRERHEKEKADIKKSVFDAVFGIQSPKHVIDAAFREILSTEFVRSNHRSLYKMKISEFEVEGGTKIKGVLLTTFDDYELENVSHNPADMEIKIEIEKPSLRGVRPPKDLQKLVVDGVEIGPDEIRAADLEWKDSNVFKRYEYKVKNVAPGGKVFVQMQVALVRGLDDTEVWYSLVPSDGLTLQVQLPPEIRSFGAFGIHRSDLQCTQNDLDEGYIEWRINSTTLPYQGIAFWWRHSDTFSMGDGLDAEADTDVRSGGDFVAAKPHGSETGVREGNKDT